MTIPKIILQQLLFTNRTIVGSWGISRCYATSETMLALRVHARFLDGFVCINLDTGYDLYDISFYSNKDLSEVFTHPVTAFETITQVYCDQLVAFIDNQIENRSE